jgi:cytochrome c peroxidase
VHLQDSVLGLSSLSPNPGLSTSYAALIQAAFRDRFWANNTQKITYNASGVPTVNAGAPTTDLTNPLFHTEFSQMEANFSLFFGIALQVYQMTLLADDSKFDQFLEGAPGVLLTAQEERGFELFALSGCGACHENPEFTAHAQRLIQFISSPNQNPSAAIGVERQVKFGDSYVDEGIYNIGVRPTGEDIGRGGRTAPGFDTRPAKQRLAKDGSFPLSFTELAVALRDGKLPLDTGDHTALAEFVPPLPTTARAIKRTEMVKGAFKVPTLHNIEVLGPFFHNGSVATLSQVIDFYARGGNFPATNARELHPAIIQIPTLQFGFDEITPPLPPEAVHESIVSFLLTLTDERVKEESGVFDRPQIFIPNWVPAPGEPGVVDPNFEGSGESFAEIPAVGTGGREAFGVDGNGNRVFPPIGSFMDLVQ